MTRRAGIVGELALSDLFHEWVLTLCLVLALAAVISPLLLLMGLKHGTIATLRHQLVQDPINREIRPTQTREYPPRWFKTTAARNEVGFITPTILAASSIISVVKPSGGPTEILDLVPTGSNDPLLLENGGRIPEGNECVLTSAAAQTLKVSESDTIKVRATRSRNSRREQGEAELRVAAILGPRAGNLPRIYAPLDFVLDVENYKEGTAVPKRGWPGGSLRPYFSYDGFIVVLGETLSQVEESGLIINTGLTSIKSMTVDAYLQRTGLKMPPGRHAYDLRVTHSTVQLSSVNALKGKLRGKGAVLLPYADEMQVRLTNGQSTDLFGLSLTASQARMLGLEAPPPWPALLLNPENATLHQILLPEGATTKTSGEAAFSGINGALNFPLKSNGASPGKYAMVPAELIGILRTARQREVSFDAEAREFKLERAGFRGFRLYTKSIDDVAPLVQEFRDAEIEVIAQVEAIERVRILDRGLTRIFWLVAFVGITGGIAALIASLYAAVERKKQELSVLRLIGFDRSNVFLFPLYQSATIALLSIMTAMLGYFSLAEVINRVFSSDLDLGQRICELPPHYLIIAATATLSVALLSALVGAWRTQRIDPADALRYE